MPSSTNTLHHTGLTRRQLATALVLRVLLPVAVGLVAVWLLHELTPALADRFAVASAPTLP